MINNAVLCPSCGKKYKRPEKADKESVNVKCKQCGNVFVIEPPSHKSEEHQSQFNDWLIRKSNGNIVRAKNHTEIQLLIVKKEVVETDEISQTGSDWSKLSDIDILKPFFEALKESEKTEKLHEAEEHLKIEDSPVIIPSIREENEKKEEIEDIKQPEHPSNEPEKPVVEISKIKPEKPAETVQEEKKEESIYNKEEKTAKKQQKKSKSSSDDDFDSLFMNDDEVLEKEKRSKIPLIFIIILIIAGAAGAAYYFLVYSKNNTSTIENKIVEETVSPETPENIESEPQVETNEEPEKAAIETKVETKKEIVKESAQAETVKKQNKDEKPVAKKTETSKWKSNITLGWNALDKSNFKAALSYFNSAIKENPSAADAYFGLGETYNAMGNRTQAKLNYKKFLTFNPKEQDRKEVENILKNL